MGKVAGKYQLSKPPSFKEESIAETRRISHLHDSVLFTIPLNSKASSINNFYHA